MARPEPIKPLASGDAQTRTSSGDRHASLGASEIRALFGVLQREVDKEKSTLEPARRAGIESFMDRLGQLVASQTGDRTLDEMIAGRGTLDALVREIQPQGKKPSLKGPGAPPGSQSERLLAALQDLKMFVWSAGMRPGMPAGLRDAAIDLFPRIGRLTTWINEAGGNAAKVRQLESDQARALANEVRLFARRGHLMLARPVWRRFEGLTEANRIFFSGPSGVRHALTAAAAALGVETDHPGRPGADGADHRWQELRAANVAVFDLTGCDPQVCYELGIALAIGSQLLLVAGTGTRVPFDVAQNVRFYEPGDDLPGFFVEGLHDAFYGLHVRGAAGSSLRATLAYATRLAAADGTNPLRHIALRSVQNAVDDPARFQDALTAFNGYLGARQHDILLPRWPGAYPDPREPRCFAVLPYRDATRRAHAVVDGAARSAGVVPVRGDVAEGQQIIESIWEEIGRATHVTADLTDFNPNVCLELGMAHTLGRPTRLIGREGTERALQNRLPAVAKWRCHTYGRDADSRKQLQKMLEAFFAKTVGV